MLPGMLQVVSQMSSFNGQIESGEDLRCTRAQFTRNPAHTPPCTLSGLARSEGSGKMNSALRSVHFQGRTGCNLAQREDLEMTFQSELCCAAVVSIAQRPKARGPLEAALPQRTAAPLLFKASIVSVRLPWAQADPQLMEQRQ